MKKINHKNSTELVYSGERLVTNIQNSTMIEHLHRYAFVQSFIEGREVLDIASGEGYGSNLMATKANSVVGVDISKEAVKHSQQKYKRKNLSFLEGAADHIPISSSTIDVVVSFETIEHHDKHDEMLMEIKRVLRNDGVLIMSSPDKLNYTDIPTAKNEFHVKELYTSEFKELVSRHFKYHYLFFQKVVYGSLLVPEQRLNTSNFKEFSGDYISTKECDTLVDPLYNICVASDTEIDIYNLQLSFYNKSDLLDDMLKKKDEYEHIERLLYTLQSSYAFKIGRILTFPIRWVRSL